MVLEYCLKVKGYLKPFQKFKTKLVGVYQPTHDVHFYEHYIEEKETILRPD